MAKTNAKPRFLPVLALRCPYCGVTPLRKRGSWFSFAPGCPQCDYNFEREIGYYAGASWMVNFPVVAVSGFLVAGILMITAPSMSGELVALLSCLYILAFGIWFTPYSMAIWLYFEHRLHPLNPGETYDPAAAGRQL